MENKCPIQGIYVSALSGYLSDDALSANVEGVFLEYSWYKLQDKDGNLITTDFEERAMKIVNAGKKIILGVKGGNNSSAYVFYKGVEKLKFVEYRGNSITRPLVSFYVPNVMNINYIKYWLEFLDKFNTYLQSKPQIYTAITGVKIGGLNRDTVETRLNCQRNLGESTDAYAIWKSVHYNEEYIYNIWRDIVNKYIQMFPDKVLIGAVLSGQAFPCIDLDSQEYIFTKQSNFSKLLLGFLALQGKLYEQDTASQFCSLTEVNGYPTIIREANTTFKGTQQNMSRFGKNVKPIETYRAMLDYGIACGFPWNEVSEANVVTANTLDQMRTNDKGIGFHVYRETVEEYNIKLKQRNEQF